MVRRWLGRGAVGVVLLLVLIQLVPYGHHHANPQVIAEPAWSSPEVRALAVRACFDCHSNQTRWPWYSNVAPVSWGVQRDVEEGRRTVNFSEWNRPQPEAGDSAESVIKAEMPPAYYVWMHPEAKLSATERRQLIDGLVSTFGTEEGVGRR